MGTNRQFLCDQMCAELGRWLRAAGYDTAIIDESLEDQLIYEKAKAEKRTLIARDRGFIELDPGGKNSSL